MQLTPKAKIGAINAVSDAQIRGFIVKKLRTQGRLSGATSAEITAMVQKERARRRSSVGYHAYAGWHRAAKTFGGTGVKGITGDFDTSLARHGRGKRARAADLAAEISNTTPAIERIGVKPLQQAIDNAAGDLVVYGQRKLQEKFNKVNP